MMNKKRWTALLAAFVISTVTFGNIGSSTAFAYFNRGTVGVRVGRENVSVEAGSNTSVSVFLTPVSDPQLEGCGMAECPQICGEKECLDENGQCTCNGKDYKTYYTNVAVASSNTSVATASYSGGTLTVQGVSEGTAVITLTASLRQFSSGNTSVTVQVNSKPSAGNPAPGNGTISSPSGNASHSSVTSGTSHGSGQDVSAIATQVGENTSSEETPVETIEEENADGVTVVNSDRGTITFVPIKNGKMGATYLEAVKEKDEYVDFQKKDTTGNILYAWEFCGEDLESVFDVDFNVVTGKAAFDGCELFRDMQALYLHFGQDGKLPGKAKVFLKVPEDMKNGSKWYLYRYDSKNDTAEKIAENLTVENGYITIELQECFDCVLSDKEIMKKTETSDMTEDETQEKASHSTSPYIVGGLALVIACAAYFVWKKKKQDQREIENNEDKQS